LLVLASLMLIVVLLLWRPGGAERQGDARATTAAPVAAPAVAQPNAKFATHTTHTIKRPFLIRPPDLYVESSQEAARRYRREQAKELFGTVKAKLVEVRVMSPDKNPEALAAQMMEYLFGWVDGVVRAAPDLVDEFASEVQDTLCTRDQDPALLLTTFKLVSTMPELATGEAFDCVFAHNKKEDVVLWQALDAWHATGLPKSDAIAEIERDATDQRTRMHMLGRRADEPRQPLPELQASATPTDQTGMSAPETQGSVLQLLQR
jgi:hypothetical protein